jgi:hypothetical protein
MVRSALGPIIGRTARSAHAGGRAPVPLALDDFTLVRSPIVQFVRTCASSLRRTVLVRDASWSRPRMGR